MAAVLVLGTRCTALATGVVVKAMTSTEMKTTTPTNSSGCCPLHSRTSRSGHYRIVAKENDDFGTVGGGGGESFDKRGRLTNSGSRG